LNQRSHSSKFVPQKWIFWECSVFCFTLAFIRITDCSHVYLTVALICVFSTHLWWALYQWSLYC
jgi:hypothetical protein